MAKYHSKVRAGKTIRERLELLLEANPYQVSRVAPSRVLIVPPNTEYSPREHFAEPLVYDSQKPDEVMEFFTALLEIFTADRKEAPENRRIKEEFKWHKVIDELEERFALFKGKLKSNNSDLTAAKATAKKDLDGILKTQLLEWEQVVKSIGVDAYHSVNQSPQEIATYITDKLEKHRQEKKREQIRGELTPIERVLRILDPTRPDFIHRRFFQAFVGYKCEELKQAIDDYNPQTERETSSLGEVSKANEVKAPDEWPLKSEFFAWLREQQSPNQLLLLACRVTKFDPYKSKKGYQKEEVTELLRSLTGKKSFKQFCSCLTRIESECKSLDELGQLLIAKPQGDTVLRLLQQLRCAPLSEETKARIAPLLLLQIN